MPSLADYRIEGQLGSGTYGKVYKVRRLSDDAILVLKQVSLRNLSAREQKEALNESRLMGSGAPPARHTTPRVIHAEGISEYYYGLRRRQDLAEVIERKRAESGAPDSPKRSCGSGSYRCAKGYSTCTRSAYYTATLNPPTCSSVRTATCTWGPWSGPPDGSHSNFVSRL